MKITTELLNEYYQHGKITNITYRMAAGIEYTCYQFTSNDELILSYCDFNSNYHRDSAYEGVVFAFVDKIYEFKCYEGNNKIENIYFVLFSQPITIESHYFFGEQKPLVRGVFLDGGGYLLEDKKLVVDNVVGKYTLGVEGLFYKFHPAINALMEILELKLPYATEIEDECECGWDPFFELNLSIPTTINLLGKLLLIDSIVYDGCETGKLYYFLNKDIIKLDDSKEYSVDRIIYSYLNNSFYLQLKNIEQSDQSLHQYYKVQQGYFAMPDNLPKE